MNLSLVELIRPSPVFSQGIRERLSNEQDWNALCDLINRFGLAPLIYERCRTQSILPPQHVLKWLETRHAQTARGNARLLEELTKIDSAFSDRGIPALVLKGPVLAHLSTGLFVRSFRDLDLLVKQRDLGEVTTLLRAQGFVEPAGASREYHEVFVRIESGFVTMIEVHFNLVDGERSYTPDLAGLWDRSTSLDLNGRVITTLSLTDHLLLAMMQLPHHHWNLRLLTEIGTLVDRWKDVIDWDIVVARARRWGMSALAGSTLDAVAWLLQIALPEKASRFAEPEGYVRRMQWEIVRKAVVEQFEASRLRSCQLASLLLSDRFADAASLIARKASCADLSGANLTVPAGIRRFVGLGANLPLLFRLLAEAAIRRNPDQRAFS